MGERGVKAFTGPEKLATDLRGFSRMMANHLKFRGCMSRCFSETWECRRNVMLRANMTGKQKVESLLHKLPDNCSLEDIQYHLYVLETVQRGLDEARFSRTLSQDEAEKRLGKWLFQ